MNILIETLIINFHIFIMYGYLILTHNSLPFTHQIAVDYHSTIIEMETRSQKEKKNYVCFVYCLKCGVFFRLKLAYRTGIPYRKIHKAKALKEIIYGIAGDSYMDDGTFVKSMKIYDSSREFPNFYPALKTTFAE